ncbi:hypothetical protein DSO57_1001563 [Entomophthora muscae]|uniref:Uncharacterized protein n=1 Tax=Entomophthora muscae TaxID=34485 RepID=A0ACC2SB37_9FUNG|nr:hypothetical protein DSO57_1001563 [Entomophthora muscae]
MLNLQLESFAGGVKGANIISWLHSTKTRLSICQVPEPMWVGTVLGRLTGPAAVWFTNWASQEIEVTWSAFKDVARSHYSKTFSPIVVGTPFLASKQTGSILKYLATWQQALAAAPEAVTDGNAMLLVRIPLFLFLAASIFFLGHQLCFCDLYPDYHHLIYFP